MLQAVLENHLLSVYKGQHRFLKSISVQKVNLQKTLHVYVVLYKRFKESHSFISYYIFLFFFFFMHDLAGSVTHTGVYRNARSQDSPWKPWGWCTNHSCVYSCQSKWRLWSIELCEFSSPLCDLASLIQSDKE